MLSYCLKFRRNTEIKIPDFSKTKNGKIILLSRWTTCNRKKSKFIREHEGSGLLSKSKIIE